jgi:hypothetical protein
MPSRRDAFIAAAREMGNVETWIIAIGAGLIGAELVTTQQDLFSQHFSVFWKAAAGYTFVRAAGEYLSVRHNRHLLRQIAMLDL